MFKSIIKRCLATRNPASREEILSMQKTAEQIVEKHINPNILKYEQDRKMPLHEIFKILGDAGLLGVSMPEEYGGLNLSYRANLEVMYALASTRNGGLPMAIGVQTDMATPALANHGSHFLKENFLKPAIAGDMVSCIGVSEPHAGSDVANIKSTATYDPKTDEYIINGGKIWTTNVTQADWMCMLCNTDPNKPKHMNKSLFIVPLNLPGITITSHNMEKSGMISSDWGQTYFDNVRIPASHLIGKLNHGFIYQMEQFQFERLIAGAFAIRPMEMIIQETIEYCQNRPAFEGKLIDNQFIKYKLAELATEVELLKNMTFATAEKVDAGLDMTLEASMIKYKSGILCRTLPDTCLQFWGAQGYLQDSYVNRMARDLRACAIGGGADEVMLQIIAKLKKM